MARQSGADGDRALRVLFFVERIKRDFFQPYAYLVDIDREEAWYFTNYAEQNVRTNTILNYLRFI